MLTEPFSAWAIEATPSGLFRRMAAAIPAGASGVSRKKSLDHAFLKAFIPTYTLEECRDSRVRHRRKKRGRSGFRRGCLRGGQEQTQVFHAKWFSQDFVESRLFQLTSISEVVLPVEATRNTHFFFPTSVFRIARATSSPVISWHLLIQQDDIESCRSKRPEGLFAIFRGHHLVAVALQLVSGERAMSS